MATRTPSPVWSNVNFIEDGEKGNQSVLNRPLYVLDDKAEYLDSNLEELTSNVSCFCEKVGETLGSDCSTGSCIPCWTSPSYFGANDTYKEAITALDAGLYVADQSLAESAVQALQSLYGYTGLSYLSTNDLFTGQSYIDGMDHHDALISLDDNLYVVSVLGSTHDISIGNLETSAASMTTAIASNAADIASNDTEISSIVSINTVQNNNIDSIVSLISDLQEEFDDHVSSSIGYSYVYTHEELESIIECIVDSYAADCNPSP